MQVTIAGAAGCIGFHPAELLLQKGRDVARHDRLTDYHDVTLNKCRDARLGPQARFSAIKAMLEDMAKLDAAVDGSSPM